MKKTILKTGIGLLLVLSLVISTLGVSTVVTYAADGLASAYVASVVREVTLETRFTQATVDTEFMPTLDTVLEERYVSDTMGEPTLDSDFVNRDVGGTVTSPALNTDFGEREIDDGVVLSSQGLVTIQYRGNGHTSGTVPASQTLTTPGSISLRSQGSLARTNHVFVGWRDSAGNILQAGSIIGWDIAISGTLTLDAYWIPSVVTIQYRGNGHTSGTVPASQTLTTPGSIALRPQGNLARTNHVFVGWRDSAGNILQAGSTIGWSTEVAGTLTLDAYWIPSVVTIHYNGNGHTSGTVPANQTITTPGTINLHQQGSLRRTGRVFIGWRDSAGTIVPPGATIGWNNEVAGTLTLNAHWVDWIWHQDVGDVNGNLVGFWPGAGSINVHTHTLGTVSPDFVYHFRMLQAQQEWSNALSVPITGVTQAVDAHIRSWGGPRAEIDAFRGEPSTWAGLAEPPVTTWVQSIIVNDVTNHVLSHSGQGRMFTIERANADEVRMIATHELGHSLGYWGHSTDNQDIMWPFVSTNVTLRANEIRHLRQIYDHFR